jgi:hypothetical protein
VSVKGYLIFVPFENVASMEYGGTPTTPGSVTRPDMVTVATTPGHLAGPFEARQTVRDDAFWAALRRAADDEITDDAFRALSLIADAAGCRAATMRAGSIREVGEIIEARARELHAKAADENRYDDGYRDGGNSLIADISVQFDDAADTMDDLLGFFRRLTGNPNLAWPGEARDD